MILRRYVLPVCLLALVPTGALAHGGGGVGLGLGQGFLHPLTGVDHVLAMAAVGLIAASVGGRGLWAVPLSFLAMMAIGGALAGAGIGLPGAELVIASSVIVLGAVLVFDASLSLAAAMALVGGFALFHGHAHGVELPVGLTPIRYAAGFLLATAVLHAAGVGLGVAASRLRARRGRAVLRIIGGGMAFAGLGLLAGLV
jgi:urease accessory protein